MLRNKKFLILAGLTAYAYYKYNSMTPEAKQKLTEDIKLKGKNIFDKYVPDQVKQFFRSTDASSDHHHKTSA